jgi:hypothetical protein
MSRGETCVQNSTVVLGCTRLLDGTGVQMYRGGTVVHGYRSSTGYRSCTGPHESWKSVGLQRHRS